MPQTGKKRLRENGIDLSEEETLRCSKKSRPGDDVLNGPAVLDSELNEKNHLEVLILGWLENLPHLPNDLPKLLPKLKMKADGTERRPSIVLDLDQTLIYTNKELATGFTEGVNISFENQNIWIHPRPGLLDFLKKCRACYTEMILWTAAKSEYAKQCLRILDIEHYFDETFFNADCHVVELRSIIPVEFQANIFVQNPSTSDEDQGDNGKLFFKPLCLLNREQCFLVDDSKEMIALNSRNQIINISPFTGDINDKELSKILPLLEQLSQSRNIEDDIEKYHVKMPKTKEKIRT